MKKTKILSLVLAIMMAVSVFAGCKKTTSSDESSGTTSGSFSPATLKVELFDRGNTQAGETINNSAYTKYYINKVKEAINVDLQFVMVPRSQEVEQINTMVNAKTAPDIMYTYSRDLVMQYAGMGGLADLTKLYDKEANIKKVVGDNISWGTFDGKVLSIPAIRPSQSTHTDIIRRDLVKAVGMSIPTTTDEWYKVMTAIKQQDPAKWGANANYPVLGSLIKNDNYDIQAGFSRLIWSFVDPKITDKQRMTVMYWDLPGYKDAIKYLNKIYNEGLIYPDFATTDSTVNQKLISSGKYASYCLNIGTGITDDYYKSLMKNVPTADPYPVEIFKNSAGKYAKAMYPAVGMYIFVPVMNEKNSEVAMRYLNWLGSSEGTNLANNGIEGVDYKLVDGKYKVPLNPNEKPTEWQDKKIWAGGDIAIFKMIYPSDIVNGEKKLKYEKYTDIDGKVNATMGAKVYEMDVLSEQISVKEGFIDYNRYPPFDKEISSVTQYYANVLKIYCDGIIKLISGTKPADFDKVWNQLYNDYMQGGGTQIQKDKEAAFDKMKK